MKASVMTVSSPMPTCGESALGRGSTWHILVTVQEIKYDVWFFSMKL
jgi:hypothetical protein